MTEASCCCPKPMYESFFMIDRRLTTLSRPAANVRALSRMARQVIRSNKSHRQKLQAQGLLAYGLGSVQRLKNSSGASHINSASPYLTTPESARDQS